MTDRAVSAADILAAYGIISPLVHRTPVITSRLIDEAAGRHCYFKCENLQKIGAFKFRGASHAVARLSSEEAARGVCTHSSGNHAQALALAAAQKQIPAYIVMPETAPRVKVEAVLGYGAEITFCQPTQAARESTAREIVERTGATFIHPYDNPHVIAGQGTAALELLEEYPDLDTIVVPVGGGGLAAGTCLAAHHVNPKLKIIAAEPAGADDCFRSWQTGERQPMVRPNTIADGLLTGVGELTWPILQDHLSDVMTVTDAEIVAAMELFWTRAKLLIEPSGAVPLAAALSRNFPPESRSVGIILSGGNVDVRKLPF
ncbi:MAG TPA: pyridoxal-phosphate dependent enzyme [Planctomycetaceae bacterium]|nr:pyridoxal-phosphate dependent enzyme [Planctomycetaceae bacterium]